MALKGDQMSPVWENKWTGREMCVCVCVLGGGVMEYHNVAQKDKEIGNMEEYFQYLLIILQEEVKRMTKNFPEW